MPRKIVMFHRVSTDDDIGEVVKIARNIWIEHYTPIVGIEQVEYMLCNFHTKDVISKEISQHKYMYYLIKDKNRVIGYLGILIKSDDLFLSKLYILSSARGLGVGRAAMNFIKKLAQKNHVGKITLTVNRNNTGSIAAYYKLGFAKTGEVIIDIGEGYKMDDYKMEMVI